MNNISNSEYCSTSGCESGWTSYFYELSNSTLPHDNRHGGNVRNDHDDLSLVSDASSGPPKLHENYGVEPRSFGSSSASVLLKQVKKNTKAKRNTKGTRMIMKRNHSLCLEDTASSPFLHFSQENTITHQNHSYSANFEEQHRPENSLGTSQSSTKGKSGSLKGKKGQ